MNDETQVAEELYAFARALVGKIAHRRRGEHWNEDAVQDLVLAGLQAYRDTRDIGPAKHRAAGQKMGARGGRGCCRARARGWRWVGPVGPTVATCGVAVGALGPLAKTPKPPQERPSGVYRLLLRVGVAPDERK